MDDVISRQAAIDAIEQMQIPIMRSAFEHEQFIFKGMCEALNAVKEVPSAQPEHKKGKWLRSGSCIFPYECDQCGDTNERATPFCPNCGADMRGEQDE